MSIFDPINKTENTVTMKKLNDIKSAIQNSRDRKKLLLDKYEELFVNFYNSFIYDAQLDADTLLQVDKRNRVLPIRELIEIVPEENQAFIKFQFNIDDISFKFLITATLKRNVCGMRVDFPDINKWESFELEGTIELIDFTPVQEFIVDTIESYFDNQYSN